MPSLERTFGNGKSEILCVPQYDGVNMARRRILGTVRQEAPTRWTGRALDPAEEVTARSKEACIRKLERELAADSPHSIVIEVERKVVGVAEAARIIGWDKRHVITYLNRGKFPEPLASLASGRIWALDDIVAFARELRDRRSLRVRPD